MNNMMNQIGKNPMLINPIGFNQMGINPISMNNQINQMGMDQTTMDIKNIVKPYEDKIKELEEKIRQKDFEIAVLKQKLNKNSSNINFMKVNMNQMMMNQNINPMLMNETSEIFMHKKDEITIILKYENELNHVQCLLTDKISILREKFNIMEKNSLFVYNYIILDENKNFNENRIKNLDIIEVKFGNVQYIKFITVNGKFCGLNLFQDCPINIALVHCLLKFGNPFELLSLLNNKAEVIFLYNACPISIKNETPISIFFKNVVNPDITVNYSHNLNCN